MFEQLMKRSNWVWIYRMGADVTISGLQTTRQTATSAHSALRRICSES
jgi:hypothetical protein